MAVDFRYTNKRIIFTVVDFYEFIGKLTVLTFNVFVRNRISMRKN